jgi:hypothetical protein
MSDTHTVDHSGEKMDWASCPLCRAENQKAHRVRVARGQAHYRRRAITEMESAVRMYHLRVNYFAGLPEHQGSLDKFYNACLTVVDRYSYPSELNLELKAMIPTKKTLEGSTQMEGIEAAHGMPGLVRDAISTRAKAALDRTTIPAGGTPEAIAAFQAEVALVRDATTRTDPTTSVHPLVSNGSRSTAASHVAPGSTSATRVGTVPRVRERTSGMPSCEDCDRPVPGAGEVMRNMTEREKSRALDEMDKALTHYIRLRADAIDAGREPSKDPHVNRAYEKCLVIVPKYPEVSVVQEMRPGHPRGSDWEARWRATPDGKSYLHAAFDGFQ